MRFLNISGSSKLFLALFIIVLNLLHINTITASAQTQSRDFALQVYPSPVVEVIKPGQTKTIKLQIRNNGSQTENLQIKTRSFNYDSSNGQVKLGSDEVSQVKKWIIFENPFFKISPGQWFTEKITINTPKTAGFSYSFALVISRKSDLDPAPGTPAIHGSVAVFVLLNVDRPDAKKQLELSSFLSQKRIYEYLPADFKITFKNTGNTIIQPYGNIFIQRDKDSKTPITLLPVNEAKSYILPGTSRTLSSTWTQGFPRKEAVKLAANSPATNRLVWDWDKIKDFRIGRYSAVLIGAYSNGHKDISIRAELTFWVIPWKLIMGGIAVLAILMIGLYTILKKGYQIIPRRKKHSGYKIDNIS
jgi:hypothetical protein